VHAPIPDPSDDAPPASLAVSDQDELETTPDWIQTEVDPRTKTFRRYPHLPSVDPDANVPLVDLNDSPELGPAPTRPQGWFSGMTRSLAGLASRAIFAPFENITQFRFMAWHYNDSPSKSVADTNAMLSIMKAPEFRAEHVADFTIEKGQQLLDRDTFFATEDGWQEASLSIKVPCTGHRSASEALAPTFSIPGFFYRNILSVIVSFFQNAAPGSLHFTPFEQWCQYANGTKERVYTELYNSQAWIDEHLQIMHDFRHEHMEKAIAAVMWYSDSTLLAQFGGKTAWPIYQFFGNQTKYTRNKTSTFSAQHIGYVPSVRSASYAACVLLMQSQIPNSFKLWFKRQYNKLPNADIYAHVKRELMRAVWMLMLDDKLMHAYVHGIVIECADGVKRLIFPRFFLYSADYPEK
jgi:hypothetical protein